MAIAKCPECGVQLSVGDNLDLAARARCPACSAEFTLANADVQELLAIQLLDQPPGAEASEGMVSEFVPHTLPSSADLMPPASTGGEASAAGDPDISLAQAADADGSEITLDAGEQVADGSFLQADESPEEVAEFLEQGEIVDSAVDEGQPTGFGQFDSFGIFGTGENPETGETFATSEADVVNEIGDPALASEIPQTGESSLTGEAEGSFAFGGSIPAGDAEAGEPIEIAPIAGMKARKPAAPQKGGVGLQIMGAVVGGVLAVPITQMLLWWVFGKDPIRLAPNLPSFISFLAPENLRNPPSKQQRNADSSGADKVAKNGDRGDANPSPPADSSEPKPMSPEGTSPDTMDDPQPAADPERPSTDPERPSTDPDRPMVAPDEPKKPDDLAKIDPPVDPPKNPTIQDDPFGSEAGVIDPPKISSDLFGEAMIAAHSARSEYMGIKDDADAQKVNGAKIAFYKALAALGEAVSFADFADKKNLLRVGAVSELLHDVGIESSLFDPFSKATGNWLSRTSEKRGGTQGILVAGIVGEIVKEGPYFVSRILTGDLKTVVDVYSVVDPQDNPRSTYGKGQKVLILGYILENPDKRLHGFTGEPKPVVWGGYPFGLKK